MALCVFRSRLGLLLLLQPLADDAICQMLRLDAFVLAVVFEPFVGVWCYE